MQMALRASFPEVSSDSTPALRTGLIVRRIGDEAVVWSDLRSEPAHLDSVASVMLDVIDGVATTAELIEDVQYVVDIDHFAARSQVKRVLSLFDVAGMLTSSVPAEPSFIELRPLLPEPDW